MSCVLHITGNLDPEPILKQAGWDGDVTRWRKGELNRKGIPFERSGILITVSDVEFDQFEKQIADAIDSLKNEYESLRSILCTDGVQEGTLDFGSHQSKAPAYFRVFPAELVRLAGEIGLGLEISLYAVSDMGGFESRS